MFLLSYKLLPCCTSSSGTVLRPGKCWTYFTLLSLRHLLILMKVNIHPACLLLECCVRNMATVICMWIVAQQQRPKMCLFFFFFLSQDKFQNQVEIFEVKADEEQTLVCVFLISLFRRVATASHRLLNSPIRYKATVTHEGWVCVLLTVLSTFVSFLLKSS